MPQRDIIPKKVAKLRTDVDYLLYQNSQGGGSSSLFPVTGTGTATGAVIGSLAGNTFSINQDETSLLILNPTPGGEFSRLRALNTTDNGNASRVDVSTTNTEANFQVLANFNDGVKRSEISGFSDALLATIDYEADSHQFTGNVGIGITPTATFQAGTSLQAFLSVETVTDGENVYLGAINATNDNSNGVFVASCNQTNSQAYIQSRNPTNDYNTANVSTSTADTSANIQIRANFNDGVKYSEILMEASSTISQVQIITDVLEFNGAVQFNTSTLPPEYADDAAAAVGGIVVGQLYRTGSIVKIRVA